MSNSVPTDQIKGTQPVCRLDWTHAETQKRASLVQAPASAPCAANDSLGLVCGTSMRHRLHTAPWAGSGVWGQAVGPIQISIVASGQGTAHSMHPQSNLTCHACAGPNAGLTLHAGPAWGMYTRLNLHGGSSMHKQFVGLTETSPRTSAQGQASISAARSTGSARDSWTKIHRPDRKALGARSCLHLWHAWAKTFTPSPTHWNYGSKASKTLNPQSQAKTEKKSEAFPPEAPPRHLPKPPEAAIRTIIQSYFTLLFKPTLWDVCLPYLSVWSEKGAF